MSQRTNDKLGTIGSGCGTVGEPKGVASPTSPTSELRPDEPPVDAQQRFVIVVVADNRPGLLKSMCDFVTAHDGSIVEHFVNVQGSVATVGLHVDATAEAVVAMEKNQNRALPTDGGDSALFIRRTEAKRYAEYDQPVRFRLNILSPDFVGLLSRITEIFRRYELDIVRDHGHRFTPPHPNARTEYMQHPTLLRPPKCDWKAFQRDMGKLADEIGIMWGCNYD